MKWVKKLSNPFALVFQGFIAGAIMFAATHPGLLDERPSTEQARPAAR